MEVLDLALFPHGSSDLKEVVGQLAGWVWRVKFRLPDHLASVVESGRPGIVAAKRGERCHHAVSPNKGETYKVGTVPAKVFPIWILSSSVRTASNLTALAGSPSCITVRPSECAEVSDHTFPPEDCVLGCIAGQVRISLEQALVVSAPGQAIPPPHGAEIGNGVRRRLVLLPRRREPNRYRQRNK